jgi:hypothetical protein
MATLLPNGKVLVTGGDLCCLIALSSAELYDPSTGTWVATGSMHDSRSDSHTATLLPNGQVLVAGGGSGSCCPWPEILSSAELYDPSSGTWAHTGSMTTGRYGDMGTLLPNGLVLVVGGSDTNCCPPHSLASAELYSPSSGTWTATGSMSTGRSFSFALTLLTNGQVLVAGGWDSSGRPLASAELYTPMQSQQVLTVQTTGLGSAHTHITNAGTLLGVATDATPLRVTLVTGTPLALAADALVSGANGIQYFFQGFTPPLPATLTADVTTTARYETMAQLIGDALATGGIYGPGAHGQANALTQQFAAVQEDLAAHNDGQALVDLQSFINHVQAQTGKKITPATATTLELDALLVYHAALCLAESAGQISAAQASADYGYYCGLVTQLGATPLGPC